MTARENLPWNIGQFGSNTSYTMTRTNYVAAQDMLAKLKEIAAQDLGGKPDDYDVDGAQGVCESESLEGAELRRRRASAPSHSAASSTATNCRRTSIP